MFLINIKKKLNPMNTTYDSFSMTQSSLECVISYEFRLIWDSLRSANQRSRWRVVN